MLRLHSPLIEPDVRICRIRLSDKDSCLRPQEAVASVYYMNYVTPSAVAHGGMAQLQLTW